ncbi:hypothetical protein PV328_000219 [Microctonus aethiopoides]|uniref:DNA polymerase V n=1 Tax=Microctonus aethiopoides TaxID=144406 RepID=A0AA39FUF2_9HYME|nr:hypothetical protein PV328_000219 [Microctonus aethiopoides]
MVAMESTSCNEDDLKSQKKVKMDTTILDCFTKLVADNERIRLDGELSLLKHLGQQKDNPENKELNYSLKRLIRGLGSSRTASRKGFYATLTAYFKITPDINMNDIIQIMEAELKATNSNSKSENADIHMGRILLCGALIRSKLLSNRTVEEQQKVVEILLTAGTKRSYLSFVSYSFLNEFINEFDEESLKTNLWPLLEKELGKTWSEQTLDSFYTLMIINTKFPSLIGKKFLKQHLGSSTIINTESMDDLIKLLTDIPRVVCCRHPIYKIFCEHLSSTKYVVEFWTGIDEKFLKPSKSMENVALTLLNLLLLNIKDKSLIPSLLSPNFLQHMLRRIVSCKRYRNDDVAVSFKQMLTQLVSVLNDKEMKGKIQIAVLKKLILYPGDLMIEKITGTKVIQMITANMGVNGVKKLSKFYSDIASNSERKITKDKEEFWTNAERTYAAQLLSKLLGHSAVSAEHTWRLEQLKFLFHLGHYETTNVGIELAPQFKESFYRALDHKLPKLADLRNVLSELIHHLNAELFSDAKTNTLRTALDETAIEAWKKMINFIKKLDKDSNNKEAVLIFYTMDLNMGLQLFTDPEMAISAINEIHSCYERLTQNKSTKKNKKTKVETDDDDEPQWVEVIVDLMLSLLSKNSHLLRSLVRCVFPHICPVLTATSIHQILAVLDPKDDKGPLVPKNSIDNDASDMESNSESENDESNDDNDDDDDEEGENNSDSDTDIDDGEDELEDETTIDRLRLAVRQALGDATAQTDDEDMDVDQIDEEQGKRLNESLAAAFRILRENRQSNKKKQGKSAEALTHFRVRVIDLLETYLESGPSMALALDMLVPLFALLEFCIKDPHQKPLENRVRTCLKKLSTVKKFKDTTGIDGQLLTDLAKVLIEKGERSTAVCQEMGDKLAECCIFLIRCIQQAGLPSTVLVQLYSDNLTAFFKKRDCVLPASLFKNILQLNWDGNWQLVPLIVDYTFDKTIRSFRRGQALEFLTTFYRNHRLVMNEEYTSLRQKIEKKLSKNTINLLQEIVSQQQNNTNGELCNGQNGENIGKEVRQKFICLLWTLLHAIYPHHLSKVWDWKSIGNAMAEYRKHISLSKDTKTAYNRLASQIGAPINISTQIKVTAKSSTNGVHADSDDSTQESSDEKIIEENGNSKSIKKKLKNRSKQKDKQKLKKEARELRAKAMSEGLDCIDFSSVVLPNGTAEDESADNNVLNESPSHSTKNNNAKKREPEDRLDSPVKSKKKKSTNAH